MTQPKIITLDIETSPLQVFTWGIWNVNVGLNQIIKDWSILSFCAKTLGDKEIRYADVSEQEDFYDDTAILAKIWEELDSADVVVTQNGKRFDHRKINARFLTLGMPPPSPFKMIDTKVEAAKLAMFTSNKLEWLAAALTDAPKDKHKEFPGFELWAECLKGNPRAWATMRKYNPKDVIATEKLYLQLRPWIENHPNVANYTAGETPQCPKCGSEKLQQRGYARTQVGLYHRYHCTSCGGWSRSRYTLNTKGKRAALLSQ